jgi:hypothetical protein
MEQHIKTLRERTIEAIENLLSEAPEYDRFAADGDGHFDRWASNEWDKAKSRLRDVLDEWKGQSE